MKNSWGKNIVTVVVIAMVACLIAPLKVQAASNQAVSEASGYAYEVITEIPEEPIIGQPEYFILTDEFTYGYDEYGDFCIKKDGIPVARETDDGLGIRVCLQTGDTTTDLMRNGKPIRVVLTCWEKH